MMISRRQFLKRACYVGAVATYPFLVERCLVQTNFYRIPVSNLPHSFSGFRIVQLTDLHFKCTVPNPVALLHHRDHQQYER